MPRHFSYFTEVTADPDKARVLQIYSNVPAKAFHATPDACVDVARWVPGIKTDDFFALEDDKGAWECYGEVSQNYRGITEAEFRFYNSTIIYPRNFYIPFTPVPDSPGEFRAISRFQSNPRLDRLLFSEAGNEVTLFRLHAYHPPEPQILTFKQVPKKELPSRVRLDLYAARLGERTAKHITRQLNRPEV